MKVEGIDYSCEGIEQIRTELSKIRNESVDHWPDTIPLTLLLTHTIALLAYLVELLEKE